MIHSSEIKIENVTARFGEKLILDRISLEIPRGQCTVLIGPSGQGKSLLLKMMAGLMKPSSGRVLIQGQDFYSLSQSEQFKIMQKMGMLFQRNALFDSLTCGENIAFPLREVRRTPQVLNESEIEQTVKSFLAAVDIPHAQHLFPDEISGGMQKRLGIARALALNPPTVFYDDPTAGLDPITSRKIIDLICKFQRENQSTVVAVTNDMNRAFQMAHRVVMVVDREIIVAESVQELQQHKDPRVQQFILGQKDGPLTEFAEVNS